VPDKTTLAAQTGLISNIKEEGKVYMGYPAIEYRNYIKSYAIFKKNGSPK
jgi:UDP-3-O-[3-hydroxymyristoyl] glucosamine N-acyltransferase